MNFGRLDLGRSSMDVSTKFMYVGNAFVSLASDT